MTPKDVKELDELIARWLAEDALPWDDMSPVDREGYLGEAQKLRHHLWDAGVAMVPRIKHPDWQKVIDSSPYREEG